MEDRGLFLIGEVSRLFNVSVSILRYYDKMGILCPEYKDPENGYRYYSTRQFECLNTIRYLRELRMPLEEIKKFLHNRNIGQIRNMLIRQKEEVAHRQLELSLLQRKIDHRLRQLDEAVNCELDVIREERTPARRLALLEKELVPESYLDLEQSIRLLEEKEETAIVFLGKVGLGITQESLSKKQYLPYELVFIILDEEDSYKGDVLGLPEETCLTVRFRGSHERAKGYYGQLMAYAGEHGYSLAGFSREITIIDYGITDDVSSFVTEIQVPVVRDAGQDMDG